MQRGRPRKIDPDDALENAMRVFWEKGFEGTSMADLVAATGMAKPGLYATFGDKEALYRQALDRYYEKLASPVLEDLVGSPDPLGVVIRRCLDATVAAAVDSSLPGGCFVLCGMMESRGSGGPREEAVRKLDARRLKAFVKRFRAARQSGELPPDADADALAAFFSGQFLALAAMARSGASRRTLERVVETAMIVLPGGEEAPEKRRA